MTKIKVFHLIGSLNIGGIQNVVLNMFRSIDRDRYEFHFGIFEHTNLSLEQEIYEMGGKIIVVPKIKKNYFAYFNNLKDELKNNDKYTIFHTHLHLNNGIALLAAKEAGIPIRIAHSHSVRRSFDKHSTIYNFYEKIMLKMIRLFSTNQLACSQDAGIYMFGTQLFLNQGKVFPNSIEINKFQYSKVKRDSIRKRLNLEDKVVLGNVGTLNKIKNQELIILITSNLVLQGKDVVSVIIGEGEYRDKLENTIAQKNLEDRVLLLGNEVNVNDYLNSMDVFVFPSLHEGLGIAAIEAQANGLPVITSDGVPQEVRIKENTYQIGLQQSIDFWGKKIWDFKDKRLNFENNDLIANGYDSRDTGKLIQEFYEEALSKI